MPQAPYDRLFIYELGGSVPADRETLGPDFLADWTEAGYTFLFFKSAALEAVKELAARAGAEYRSETVVDYQDWEAGRKLEPVVAGRVLVCPEWDQREPGPDQVRVVMDPGVAFGTGNHPTTERCLKVLSELFGRFVPDTVLDLGCGTGVLTAACLGLGARSAVSVEYRRSCSQTAQRTLDLNGFSKRALLICGDALDYAHLPADLLCCNIYYQVITKLADIPELFNKKWYLFSGLYAKHAEEILPKLQRGGLEIIEHHTDDKWHTLLARGPQAI